jgi:hypothetical protein
MVPFWKVPTAKRMSFGHGFGAAAQEPRQKMRRALDFLRFLYPLKLDFCRMTINEMASMVQRVLQEDQTQPGLYRPLVAIGHTKDLRDPQTIDDFLCFLRSKEIAVSTFETIYPRLVCGNSRIARPASLPIRTPDCPRPSADVVTRS